MFVKGKEISSATNFRNFIGMLLWPVELSLLIFCGILLSSLCVVGYVVKESSSSSPFLKFCSMMMALWVNKGDSEYFEKTTFGPKMGHF